MLVAVGFEVLFSAVASFAEAVSEFAAVAFSELSFFVPDEHPAKAKISASTVSIAIILFI